MPTNLFGVAILIAALAPGYCYVLAYRRSVLSERRTATTEIIEFFSVGALGTFLAALVVLGLGQVIGALVSIHDLTGGTKAIKAAPWSTVVSAALVLALSVLLCTLAGIILGHRSPSAVGRVTAGIMAARVLATRSPQGRDPYLAVELSDGRLVEGYLRHAAIEEDPARRDLVLQRPLMWSGTGYSERTPSTAVKVLVPGSMIKIIHISYPPLGGGAEPASEPGHGTSS